ncbi:MAG: glycosyltransferase family 10 [Sporomusaceae bacterium]|nr:glycosyltransferase family 10 [Sporomusaceae bacterium]
MKSLAIVVDSAYGNDILFDKTSSMNRDDCLSGYRLLKMQIEKMGGVCHTFDIFQKDNIKPDIVLFLEIPKVPLQMILGEWANSVLKYVVPFECQVVSLENWDVNIHKMFDKVFTWNDNYVDGSKYFKVNFWGTFSTISQSKFVDKKQFCTLIAGNKYKGHPLELYTQRIQAIRWFETNHFDDLSLFGMGWSSQEYPSYKGKVESKFEVLEQFRFAICYENAQKIPGYITEKIFDCFVAACIPVYWGAPNIEEYIPKNCYIDRRDFASLDDLYVYLKGMDETTYNQYLENIKKFLDSEKCLQFKPECFAQTILAHFCEDIYKSSKTDCSNSRIYELHYLYYLAREKRCNDQLDEAYNLIVQAYELGKKHDVNFYDYLFVLVEMLLILLLKNQFSKVIEIGEQVRVLAANNNLDVYFYLFHAAYALDEQKQASGYANEYMKLFNRLTELPKSAYVDNVTRHNFREIQAYLVAYFLHTNNTTQGLEEIYRYYDYELEEKYKPILAEVTQRHSNILQVKLALKAKQFDVALSLIQKVMKEKGIDLDKLELKARIYSEKFQLK